MSVSTENIEKSVIGSLIWEVALISECRHALRVSAMGPKYGPILKAIYDLYDEREKINKAAIERALRSEGVLGKDVDFEILHSAGVYKDLLNFKENIEILQKKHDLGLILNLEDRIHEWIKKNPDPYFVGERIKEYLDGIQLTRIEEMKTISEHVEKVLDQAKAIKERGGFFGTGYGDLDRLMGGHLAGMLTYVGARPGIGKTTFIMDLATKCAELGQPCGIISLEMSATALAVKALSTMSGINRRKIMDGREGRDNGSIMDGLFKLKGIEIYVDDKSFTSEEITASIGKMAKKYGCKFVAIDYLELIERNDDKELSMICRKLKHASKKQGIHVILVVMLNKIPDGQRPTPANIKYISDADNDYTILLYRDKEEGNVITEANFVKNRTFGDLAQLYRLYDPAKDNFSECDVDGNAPGSPFKAEERFESAHRFSEPRHNDNGIQLEISNPNIITRTSRMNEEDIPF